jgi:hypothetical protein
MDSADGRRPPSPRSRLIGPLIALAAAIVTLPSMLGAGYDVQLNIGRWWTPFVIVVSLLLGFLLVRWRPGAAWSRRGIIGLSVLLVLYGVLIGLWGLRLASERNVPAGDLPYLIGLPFASALAGLVNLFGMRRWGRLARGSSARDGD